MDKPGYYDVTIWGNRGEAAARVLSKGSAVAIDGKLEWREWETDEGHKRSAVGIVADNWQPLTRKQDAEPADGSQASTGW